MIVNSQGKVHIYGDIYTEETDNYEDMRSAINTAAASCEGNFEMVLHDARVLPSSIIGILVKIANTGSRVTLHVNNDSIERFLSDMGGDKMFTIRRIGS